MLVNAEQFKNIWVPMVVKPALVDRVTLVKAVAKLNTPVPMLVTLFGMTIPVRLVQLLNAEFSMVVTVAGMSTLVNAGQFRNADAPMVVTPLLIMTDLIKARRSAALAWIFVSIRHDVEPVFVNMVSAPVDALNS